MPEYLSPGVYVEEIDKGPKPIESVGTATACFVGFSEKAQEVARQDGELIVRDLLNKPQLVTNWSQYVEKFGGFAQGATMPHSVYGFFQNGGSRCYVLSVKTIPKAQASLMNADGKPALGVRARQAGMDGAKLRVRVEAPQAAAPADAKPDTKKAKAADGADQPAAPAASAPSSTFSVIVEREKPSGGWAVQESLRDMSLVERQTEDGGKMVGVAFKDNKASQLIEFVIPDGGELAKLAPREQSASLVVETKALVPARASDFQGDVMERTGVEGLEAVEDITMVVVPDLMTTMPGQKLDLEMVKAVQTMIIAHCERAKDRVAVLDAPPDMNPQQVRKWRMETTGFDSSYATMYYPWVQISDPLTNRTITIPSSGHVAGIWARNDNTRGVHKAPANEVIAGVTGLAYNVTKGEQDTLNPNGVNCIRFFPGMGIRVWGARTLSSNASWRYLNVRRLFNMIEKSIEGATQWTVFEPNDQRLWGKVRRDVGAYLTTLWRDGALFGAAPSEAFFVKCDGETNPPESRDLGRLIIEIGLAPVKPAEFVIFRISQWGGPGSEA